MYGSANIKSFSVLISSKRKNKLFSSLTAIKQSINNTTA